MPLPSPAEYCGRRTPKIAGVPERLPPAADLILFHNHSCNGLPEEQQKTFRRPARLHTPPRQSILPPALQLVVSRTATVSLYKLRNVQGCRNSTPPKNKILFPEMCTPTPHFPQPVRFYDRAARRRQYYGPAPLSIDNFMFASGVPKGEFE